MPHSSDSARRTPPFPGDVVTAIRGALLTFFDTAARDLPWRRTADPYAIWISEVMSQQTRVETVVPYYYRWLDRFPDVHVLADAPLDDVLKQWEGLGYYSRARNLHAAARAVRERHDGSLPARAAELRRLPGVGEYTAGAIASIAYGQPVPAVDGNVRRVVARLLDEPDPSPAFTRDAAASLVPSERPGDFNQALMELGATICTPRAPRCGRCPVAAQCISRARGTQLERPAPRRRPDVPVIDLVTAVLRRGDGRVLIVRRPRTGLLAGLWEFPSREPGDDPRTAALAIAAVHAATVADATPLCSIEHTFSHRRERYDVWEVEVARVGRRADVAWVGGDRGRYTLPRAQQRIHARAFDGVSRAAAGS